MMKMNFSNHCIEDRNERVYEIASTVGFGEIMGYFPGAHEVKAITTTGVLFIMTPNKKKVITLYIATMAQAKKLFKGEVPAQLKKVLKGYEKKGKFQYNCK